MEGITDRVANTFDNQTVFITGGTGFVGKPLIEKLLRSTNVKRLYLLIRPKKGKQPHERIKDIFNNVVRKQYNFDSLRHIFFNFHYIIAIQKIIRRKAKCHIKMFCYFWRCNTGGFGYNN